MPGNQQDPENAYRYTGKGNTVAVVTDGTAVLGLGRYRRGGRSAGHGRQGVIDAPLRRSGRVPDLRRFKDPEDIIKVCKLISPGLGAINLEDISAPRTRRNRTASDRRTEHRFPR